MLVSGPVALLPPAGCEFHSVETTGEMYDACLAHFPKCDGVIGAAAVCDYRPLSRVCGKIGKTGKALDLELIETPDILAELGRRKNGNKRWVVGFALESQNPRENAVRKLTAKRMRRHCPQPSLRDRNRSEFCQLIDKNAHSVATWTAGKIEIARALISWIDANLGHAPHRPRSAAGLLTSSVPRPQVS